MSARKLSPNQRALLDAKEAAWELTVGTFFALLKRDGIVEPRREYRFSTRQWRFDFAWTTQRLALEVEGGVWTRGRHTRGAGFLGDMEKYNWAAVLGWRLLRVTPDQLCTLETVGMIRGGWSPYR